MDVRASHTVVGSLDTCNVTGLPTPIRSLAAEGATDAAVFEAYMERILLPALGPGQVVVMDNLGAHRPKSIRELIEQQGCELIYLPPYSPDLNPIEEALSKVKHILRKIAARTKEALIEAMGRALEAVSAQDAMGFFVHCGYHAPAQQL
jgi:transposase